MLNQIKTFAKENHVPIISDEGLIFLLQIIKEHQVKNVLEIGTAIGYSAIAMQTLGCVVDSFERDQEMINLAKENIKIYHLEQKVRIIEADALLYNGSLNKIYDLIFIDAAKAQYQKFFEKYQTYLKDDGVIICDNLSFHHLDKTKVNRNTRQLLIKLENFREFLINNASFKTDFYDIGDGMSVSKRMIK